MSVDVSSIFARTVSHIIQAAVSKDGVVLAEKLPGLNGILIKDEKFSDELQKKVSRETGIEGFISTDELPRYGITDDEKRNVLVALQAKSADVGLIVAADRDKALRAMELILKLTAGYKRPKAKSKSKFKLKLKSKPKSTGKSRPAPKPKGKGKKPGRKR